MSYERFVRQAENLKLHMAPGGDIWYGDGTSAAVSSSSFMEFLREGVGDNCRRIRVLGTHGNAALIRAVYRWQQLKEGASCRVEVGSPYRIGVSCEQERPEVVLSQMAGNTASPGVGGWHVLTRFDYVVYALIDEFCRRRRSPQVFTSEMSRMLSGHPAWPALSFIYGPNKRFGFFETAACLLAEIVDPRWHTDPEEGRITRLHTYLGIGETAATRHINIGVRRGVEEGYRPECRCYFGEGSFQQRADLVLYSWFWVGEEFGPRCGGGPIPLNPRAFLAKHRMTPYEIVGACRKFVNFIRDVWLDNVQSSHQGRMFAPDHFFKEYPGTLEAWQNHVAQLGRQSPD